MRCVQAGPNSSHKLSWSLIRNLKVTKHEVHLFLFTGRGKLPIYLAEEGKQINASSLKYGLSSECQKPLIHSVGGREGKRPLSGN